MVPVLSPFGQGIWRISLHKKKKKNILLSNVTQLLSPPEITADVLLIRRGAPLSRGSAIASHPQLMIFFLFSEKKNLKTVNTLSFFFYPDHCYSPADSHFFLFTLFIPSNSTLGISDIPSPPDALLTNPMPLLLISFRTV